MTTLLASWIIHTHLAFVMKYPVVAALVKLTAIECAQLLVNRLSTLCSHPKKRDAIYLAPSTFFGFNCISRIAIIITILYAGVKSASASRTVRCCFKVAHDVAARSMEET